MAKRDIKQLSSYISSIKNAVDRASTLAMIETITHAEGLAKKNSTQQFTGRNGRKLSGRLLNSIYSDVEFDSKGKPKGFIGTRGIPYGAIHEFGGRIFPKNAKHLWVKNYRAPSKFRRLTPTEFIGLKKSDRRYSLFMGKSGKLIAAFTEGGNTIPLFILRDFVDIPKRPYLRPAMEQALNRYPVAMKNKIKKQLLDI